MPDRPEVPPEISREISDAHPDPGLLERFMRNDVLGADRRRVVRHLLTGCPRCVAVTRALWDAGDIGNVGDIGDFAGGRPSLPDSIYDQAFTQAADAGRRLAAASPGERLDRLRLEAHLAADRGRFEEADRILARAAEACGAAGEPALAGSALVERGTLHATLGHYESAIELLGEGADLLAALPDPAASPADPTLLAAALHRRADLLFEVGRGDEARRVIGRLFPLYERDGDRAGLLRLRWLLGKLEEDEAALLEVREGLLAAGLGLAAAQVSLDLAVVYARKGRFREIRELAAEMFPIFRTRDLRRESMAGLLVFRRAVETESASLEFLVEVARYLLGSRRTRWGSP